MKTERRLTASCVICVTRHERRLESKIDRVNGSKRSVTTTEPI
jgi:hypothetical protein